MKVTGYEIPPTGIEVTGYENILNAFKNININGTIINIKTSPSPSPSPSKDSENNNFAIAIMLIAILLGGGFVFLKN